MRKLLCTLFFLMGIVGSMSAQQTKEYVTVFVKQLETSSVIELSGAIPDSVSTYYEKYDNLGTQNTAGYSKIGVVLNLLAKYGFTVEQMNSTPTTLSTNSTTPYYTSTLFLLARPLTGKQSASKADVNGDGKVTVGDANIVVNEYLTSEEKK